MWVGTSGKRVDARKTRFEARESCENRPRPRETENLQLCECFSFFQNSQTQLFGFVISSLWFCVHSNVGTICFGKIFGGARVGIVYIIFLFHPVPLFPQQGTLYSQTPPHILVAAYAILCVNEPTGLSLGLELFILRDRGENPSYGFGFWVQFCCLWWIDCILLQIHFVPTQ